jgi:hypothetical protein
MADYVPEISVSLEVEYGCGDMCLVWFLLLPAGIYPDGYFR